MQQTNFQQRLLGTVLCASLGFNYPLLSLASQGQLLFGLPVLYLYLFGVWILFILIVRHLVNQAGDKTRDTHTGNKRA